MITAQAPGKLYIAGEYAVVEPGHPAVLVAVDRLITVRLTESSHRGTVRSTRWGHTPITWVHGPGGAAARIVVDRSPLDYVTSALTLMERLRAERGLAPRYFDLMIESELDDADGRKYGLGSSGAVTVAVIDAVARFHRMGLSPQQRFRAALLATIAVAPRASGGDVAASTYGGWISYTAPDRAALLERAADSSVAEALEAPEWQVSRVEQLGAPHGLRLLVGWTGTPASTEQLVDRVHLSAAEVDARYEDFLRQSRAALAALASAWSHDPVEVLRRLRACRRLLQDLGALRGTLIETPQLRALCDSAESAGAAGKPSGAGGGDCGITLQPLDLSPDSLLADWIRHDITPLELSAHPALPADRPQETLP